MYFSDSGKDLTLNVEVIFKKASLAQPVVFIETSNSIFVFGPLRHKVKLKFLVFVLLSNLLGHGH